MITEEEDKFWEDVRSAFARIAADPEESAAQRAEFELWDRVSQADFADEVW